MMNINKVYANVRLAVPNATLIQINKYLLAELDDINASGIEGLRKYTVTHATGTYGTPQTRTDGQSYNYYPDVNCFIIPTEVSLIEKVYYGTTQLSEMTSEGYMAEVQPTDSFYVTHSGEMYFSFDMPDAAVITIMGRFGGLTVDMMSDRYIPALSNAIIAGLVSSEYKDADAYAIYSRRAANSKIVTKDHLIQTTYTKRNGRLY
jgi:hypothetical protein